MFEVFRQHGMSKMLWHSETKNFQSQQTGWVTFGHMSYPKLHKEGVIGADFHCAAFKFAFVRNPYERFVSLYYHFQRHKLIDKMSLLEFAKALDKEGVDEVGLYNQKGLSQANPQARWLYDDEGKCVVDFIGRFHKMEDHWESLLVALGVPHEGLPRLNKRGTSQLGWRELLDIKTKDWVRNVYAEDFETFGFTK